MCLKECGSLALCGEGVGCPGPYPVLAPGRPYLYLPPASPRLFHETLSLAGKMLGFHGNGFFFLPK